MNIKITAFSGLFLFLVIFILPKEAASKVYIDLAAPAAKKLPIAIQDFKYLGDAASAKDPVAVKVQGELLDSIRSDIRFSNLFSIIEREAFLEDPAASGITEGEIDFRNWRSIGADTLIKGGFLIEKDKLTVEIRFFDAITEKQVVGKRYVGSINNPRRVMHFFADELYQELTGKKGIFATRIMFVSDKEGNKEVYISDYDGKNALKITRNRSINLSPQWSPDGKKILYVSYKKGWPSLYMLDLTNGKDTVVSAKPGINIGGRFSPDGGRVALTMSGEKSPELYLLDLNTGEYKKLTDNRGIDVSPSWSPDSTKLAFVSDTAGNPHIFVLDLTTGDIKRLTFNGKYNSSPAWSPDGKQIAFARSDSGKFNIWVMQADGSSMSQLTFENSDRNPSWSPDGRHIIFSSTARGASSLYIMRSDGTGHMKINTGIGNEKSPVWSPYQQ
ncbi:MAG: Tol-Pal system beta propeller repeat protein TolB [Deltaproteobacteria bacterium]|nr:Tol-Pal system beta propeller repeat protein TolB [Deltaproteobacteria bacterium]